MIILDINLPGPDGIRLMNDLKQSPYNHLPVVMFTNGANAPQIKALKNFGVEVIGKPDTELDYDTIARTMLNYCLHHKIAV